MEKLSFGEQLTLLRKRKGLTQTELAKRSGILREMICTYEGGRVTPRIDTIKKMAKALEMEYEELYEYLLREQEDTAHTANAIPEEEHTLFRQEEGKLNLVEEVSDVVALPVLSHVHAGDPNLISDQEIIDVIKLPRRIARSANYALEVTGMSMTETGINEGDIVLVRNQPYAENNNIVIARIGEEYTIKRLKKDEKGEIWLEPANSHYRAIKGKNFKIVGVITYMVKKFT